MTEYVIKKDYTCSYGTLKQGSSIHITVVNGEAIPYYEGYMVSGAYRNVILNLLYDKDLKNEYILEKDMIPNKV